MSEKEFERILWSAWRIGAFFGVFTGVTLAIVVKIVIDTFNGKGV